MFRTLIRDVFPLSSVKSHLETQILERKKFLRGDPAHFTHCILAKIKMLPNEELYTAYTHTEVINNHVRFPLRLTGENVFR